MSTSASELTDEQRRQHFSELGRNAVEARRARKAVIEHIVTSARSRLNLPRTVADLEVLERVAALIEGVGNGRAAH